MQLLHKHALIGFKYIKLSFSMEQAQYSKLFSFLWNIANDVLVHAFEKGKYKDIIMPMLVLRRIDVLLEPTKDKVLEHKEQLDKFGVTNQDQTLCMASGFPFYNTSKFTLKSLTNETDLSYQNEDQKDEIFSFLTEGSSDFIKVFSKYSANLKKFLTTKASETKAEQSI